MPSERAARGLGGGPTGGRHGFGEHAEPNGRGFSANFSYLRIPLRHTTNEDQRHNHLFHRHRVPQKGVRQLPRALGREPVQAALLHGAGALRPRDRGAHRRPDFLHPHLDSARRRAGLRRGEGIRAGRGSGGEPLHRGAADARRSRLRGGLRPEDAGPHAGRLGRFRQPRNAVLGRHTRLRLHRGRLQQHMGGEEHPQRGPQIRRLHGRGGGRAAVVDRRHLHRLLRPPDARGGRLAPALGGVESGVDDRGVAHVHFYLRGDPQHQGTLRLGPHGGHRGGHGIPALPVGLRLSAKVDDLLQRHLRQFRRLAPAS